MDGLLVVFGVGVLIVGGLYAWTFTEKGEKWLAHL